MSHDDAEKWKEDAADKCDQWKLALWSHVTRLAVDRCTGLRVVTDRLGLRWLCVDWRTRLRVIANGLLVSHIRGSSELVGD